jgi:hypothetical protein
MKERPILFSAPMVRAILEGRKTQTRRVVKDVPEWCREWGYTTFTPAGSISARGPVTDNIGEKFFPLKYGQRGDRLWVRETWSHTGDGVWSINAARLLGPGGVVYAADMEDKGDGWWPSIHMPREFSRITLEITGVRVERLSGISGSDAEAEGVFSHVSPYSLDKVYRDQRGPRAIEYFQRLWETINGPESWAANPWVWVVEFKRLAQEARAAA